MLWLNFKKKCERNKKENEMKIKVEFSSFLFRGVEECKNK